jgi:hypothetical protein
MMNKLTRRLAKIPEEVRDEISPYFVERMAIVDEDNRKLPKLEELNGNKAEKHLRKGLTVSFSSDRKLTLYLASCINDHRLCECQFQWAALQMTISAFNE